MKDKEPQKDPYFDPIKHPISSGGGVQIVSPDSSNGGCQMIGDNNSMTIINQPPEERVIYIVSWATLATAFALFLMIYIFVSLVVEFVYWIEDVGQWINTHKVALGLSVAIFAGIIGIIYMIYKKFVNDDAEDYDFV